MIKDLLVQLPTATPIPPVIDCACSIAENLGARLDAIAFGYEPIPAELTFEGAGAVAAIAALEQERALKQANSALAVFETSARSAGITYSTRGMSATPAEATSILGGLSRLYDLTILAQPSATASMLDNALVEAALFDSGGPTIIVPSIHKGSFLAHSVAICWDGKRTAARAMRDAMPFLTRASSIDIFAVNEDSAFGEEASAAALAAHLARRDIRATVQQLSAGRSDIYNAILSAAADHGTQFLVMGGYSHSKIQERIFGGVTRGILETMTVPVLFSH